MSNDPDNESVLIDLDTKEVPIVSCDTWEEFENELDQLTQSSWSNGTGLLYRGQADEKWELLTTLDRTWPEIDVKEYFRRVRNCKNSIEAFTGGNWEFPDASELDELLSDYDRLSIELTFGNMPAYGYLVYLRHHGFPSPLLDWTRSPYIAAYFAFNPPSGRRDSNERVSIFAYSEAPTARQQRQKSAGKSQIYALGPHVTSHRRHFLQKGEYTVCLRWLVGEWRFMRHQIGFEESSDNQNVICKFTIPISERMKILTKLDNYNLNSFSLMGSDESLMDTLALRETIKAGNRR